MKISLVIAFLLVSASSFSQSKAENEVLKISTDIFKWEVEDKIESVSSVLSEQFVVVSSDGIVSQKKAYIERLSGANFKHNAIEIAENMVVISGNTATVIGKGKFDMTISGNARIANLSYMEVFTRESSKKPWKMLALKASVIN